MKIIEIDSPQHPGVEIYSSLTGHQLRNSALLIAESPKVIKVALEEGYQPLSILCERKHITGDAAGIIAQCPDIPIFTGERELLASLTGYTLTRGVLCAMRRKECQSAAEICDGARRIAVIESVCDTTNIGSIFRSAAALGFDAIFLTPDSCDPFNRRSIRVSMGAVFKIPWTFVDNPIDLLKQHGYVTVALALHHDSIPIDSPVLRHYDRLALFLGTEGDGLSARIISQCDHKVIIPMHAGIDSLNVGAAAAVAFWHFR